MRKRLVIYLEDKALSALLPALLETGADFQVTSVKADAGLKDSQSGERPAPAVTAPAGAKEAPPPTNVSELLEKLKEPASATPTRFWVWPKVQGKKSIPTYVLEWMNQDPDNTREFRIQEIPVIVQENWKVTAGAIHQAFSNLRRRGLIDLVKRGGYKLTAKGRQPYKPRSMALTEDEPAPTEPAPRAAFVTPRQPAPIVGRPLSLRTFILERMKANSNGVFVLKEHTDQVARWGYDRQSLYAIAQKLMSEKLVERTVAGIYRITPAGRGYVTPDGKVDVKSLPRDLIGSAKPARRLVKKDPTGRSSRELLMDAAKKHPPGQWFQRGELIALSVKSGFSPITLSVQTWNLVREGKLEKQGKFFVRIPPLKTNMLPEKLEPARTS